MFIILESQFTLLYTYNVAKAPPPFDISPAELTRERIYNFD